MNKDKNKQWNGIEKDIQHKIVQYLVNKVSADFGLL